MDQIQPNMNPRTRAAIWSLGVAGAYAVFLMLSRVLVASRYHGAFWSPYFVVVLGAALLAAAALWPMLAKAASSETQRPVVESVLLYGLGGALAVFVLLLLDQDLQGQVFDGLASFVGKDLVRAAQSAPAAS
jgi:hypothetical protein